MTVCATASRLAEDLEERLTVDGFIEQYRKKRNSEYKGRKAAAEISAAASLLSEFQSFTRAGVARRLLAEKITFVLWKQFDVSERQTIL